MTQTRPATIACAMCGQELVSDALCAYHQAASADGWAAVNRIMCDFVHRGIVPIRLNAAERADDQVPTCMADAA